MAHRHHGLDTGDPLQQVILVIHLLIAIALVGVVLIQRSEGGGLGMGGGGMGNMMSIRGTANLLTRVTAVLAGSFMVTSLVLAILAGGGRAPRIEVENTPAPIEFPADSGGPSVPLSD